MSCPGVGPCEPYEIDLSCYLTVDGSLPDYCLLEGEPVSQGIIENATMAASQLLWVLTGRQFGMCTAVIRPCRPCGDPCCLPDTVEFSVGGYPSYPFKQADGTWINLACSCYNSCSCKSISEVRLPYPTCSVDEVMIDGELLDPTEYTVYNFYQLIRLNGTSWPTCNDLTKPATEPGTWSIAVTYGRQVPPLVLLGAAEMASEIIKSCVGKPCKLPQRMSSITRQGVSISFLDSMDFLDKGLTGLYFVDLAARTYNPSRLRRKSSIYSSDVGNKWNVETGQ